ncbi:hypothetical protein CQA89_30830 [Klebsiella pneumoniae]|nr:hypothetical protein CQA89_30830 [Klebsiella pneumoniae]
MALAHRQGKVTNVWVDETRPLLQGGRLTAWELGELGRALSADRRFNGRQPDGAGQVDAVWVGADRIAANGDVANKRKPCVWSKKINSCATASLRWAVRW